MAFFTKDAAPARAASVHIDPTGKKTTYTVDGMVTTKARFDETLKAILAGDALRSMTKSRDAALSLLGLVLWNLGGSVRLTREEVDAWDWDQWSVVRTQNTGGTHLELTERMKP